MGFVMGHYFDSLGMNVSSGAREPLLEKSQGC